jgi:preprotein translocase subunit SecB
MEESKFQFKGFVITRSLFERNENELSKKVSLGFSPKGVYNKKDSSFQLTLGVAISNENASFKIELEAVADYLFETEYESEDISNFFYINAPALLFPYIRAYISTLTNLSGLMPINLPTLNMTRVGEDLKANTTHL